MFRNFRRVFSHPAYWVISFGIFFVVVLIIASVTNSDLTLDLLSSSKSNLKEKAVHLPSFGSSLNSNFSRIGVAYIITVAFLIGLNVALLTYYIRQRRRITQGILRPTSSVQLTSIGGIVVIVFSIGSAALGAALAAPLLSVISVEWITSHLPFHGQEFGILAVILLSASMTLLLKRIGDPLGSQETQ